MYGVPLLLCQRRHDPHASVQGLYHIHYAVFPPPFAYVVGLQHMFHADCLDRWLLQTDFCCSCQQRVQWAWMNEGGKYVPEEDSWDCADEAIEKKDKGEFNGKTKAVKL